MKKQFCYKLRLFIFLLTLVGGYFISFDLLFSQVIITEIMYDPAGSEYYDEFIEIYNLSDQDSVNLSGWQVGDGEGFDLIVAAGHGIKLAPHQFGLLLDSGYFENSTFYNSLIPPEALVITIEGASFGRNGLSNSTPKNIILLDSSGVTVDQYAYSLGNVPGHSDEKINLSGDNSPSNWGESIPLNGTPGFHNSISPGDCDLALALLKMSSRPFRPNQAIEIDFEIENVGLSSAANFYIVGYTFFSLAQPDSTLIFEKHFSEILNTQDKMTFAVSFKPDKYGVHDLHFYLNWDKDDNLGNNVVLLPVVVPFEKGKLVINEIMYYPQTNEPEWIELFNCSDDSINLQQTKLATENELDEAVLITNNFRLLGKGDYLVLSGDSLFCQQMGANYFFANDFPRLRNTQEELFLFDPAGSLIDFTFYDSNWGIRKGFSLERIWHERSGTDSSNWMLSEFPGGTPAEFNSHSPLNTDIALVDLSVLPNPAPYPITPEIRLTLKNAGRSEIATFTVEMFDDADFDSIPQQEEQISSPQQILAIVAVDETLAVKLPLPNIEPGIHNLLARLAIAGDQNPKNDLKIIEAKLGLPKNSLVFNEIMYQPLPDQPEWVELYNTSSFRINLKDWLLLESFSENAYKISSKNQFIEPEGFCVITADSGLTIAAGSSLIITDKFPSLNNDTEALLLLDYANTSIDSVCYFSSWGGEVGISLERINPNLLGQDSSNWASSASPLGMTPGEQNSIFTAVLPSQTEISITPNPFSPDGDGREDFAVIQYDLPMKTAYVSIKIFDLMGREVCDLLNTVPSGSHNELIWNGKRNNGESLRLGIYILFLEALNKQMGLVKQVKKPIVIAGRL